VTMDIDLLALLQGKPSLVDQTRPQLGGVTLGVVTDTDDPLGLGRVKVKLPWLSDTVESAWARIAVPWAGQGMGSYFLPEVDDEVMVAFRHGDLRHPYIVGFLWSPKAKPPEETPRTGRRELRSKSGHKLQFDDLDGKERVALRSKGGHQVVLDDTSGGAKLTIADSGGKLSITLDVSKGAISIEAARGDITLRAPAGKISLQASNVEITSTQTATLKGQGGVTINGSTVRIN
jgi:uncharacterized protein involved in type VI secretion and phage assembly